MRIEALNQVNQLYNASKPKKIAPAGKEKTSDMLEISQSGKDYQIAKKAVANAPDIREDKVAAIKEALASGTYNVSAREIADKMVEDYYGEA